ncbi:MAG: L-alanine-DL-glutamate epimerase-like enolase superfamily enzyme [Planctomycetota bacterium]|jgi:L-alanine-DL-glutamate epimerase-like enolase superfamily enzyme
MKIIKIETWQESVPLTRPYKISRRLIDSVQLFFVRIIADHAEGLGSASPFNAMTGETAESCLGAMASDELREALVGQDPLYLGGLCRKVRDSAVCQGAPAARAAMDMALHDLCGKVQGVATVDMLGRCHDGLPTSITIGIKGVDETIEEAHEYLGRGFNSLKVKLGDSLSVDIERVYKIREVFKDAVHIRVDANEGYDLNETMEFCDAVKDLDLEFTEQPLPAAKLADLRSLVPRYHDQIALDENLQGEHDALTLAVEPYLCRVFNIKLMKCGGISPGHAMANIAELAGREVMWGCFDESVISLSAALHVAYSSPATKYLDLDGDFDLKSDPAHGDYQVRDGRLYLGNKPGLGTSLT